MQIKTKQGKSASILGLGGGGKIDIDSPKIAFQAGVNYFFFYNLKYSTLLNGLKPLLATNREEIIVATGSETRDIKDLRSYLDKVLSTLNINYIDIFFLEYVSPTENRTELKAALDELYSWKEKGILRYIGTSTHNRPVALQLIEENSCDVLMHRYNMAHRKAEEDVFPSAIKANIPVVAFTSTRWGSLLSGHPNWKQSPPKPVDCYRYVLQNPAVHLTLIAPLTNKQLQENLAVLQLPKLSPEEVNYWSSYGDLIYGDGNDSFDTQWT
jgi:aryl-alcohol dehydrogenase-like predicted oxidoreductase